jgi:hypothetical protein
MKSALLLALLSTVCISAVRAEDAEDIAAVRQTAVQYMESWYRGDVETMRQCLHEDLAKRSLKGPFGEAALRHTTASDMVRYTRIGYGREIARPQDPIHVRVLDLYKNIASVKIVAPHYYEYLHLGKVEGRWVIVNALYESKSPDRKPAVEAKP